jgi:hypothetical protein
MTGTSEKVAYIHDSAEAIPHAEPYENSSLLQHFLQLLIEI